MTEIREEKEIKRRGGFSSIFCLKNLTKTYEGE